MAAPDPPVPYQVVFSVAVEQRLLELANEAIARGDGPAFAAAAKEFRSRRDRQRLGLPGAGGAVLGRVAALPIEGPQPGWRDSQG